MSEISRGDLCSIKILQSSCRAPEAARMSGVDPLLSATSVLSRKRTKRTAAIKCLPDISSGLQEISSNFRPLAVDGVHESLAVQPYK